MQEFKVFHGELQEFFNATALDGRLQALLPWCDASGAGVVSAFLAGKSADTRSDSQLLDLLERLLAVRRLIAEMMQRQEPYRRSQTASDGHRPGGITLLPA